MTIAHVYNEHNAYKTAIYTIQSTDCHFDFELIYKLCNILYFHNPWGSSLLDLAVG